MPDFIDFMPWPWPELFGRKGINRDPGVIFWPDAARQRHGVIFGGTGTGKSRYYESLFITDVIRRLAGKSPRGVGLIDVHGDFYNNVRDRLALMALLFPQIESHLYLIDPVNERWSIKYNPLELRPGEFPEDRAGMLADVVTTIYHDDPVVVNRLRWLLYHSLLLLIFARRTLLDFPRLLRDKEFREGLVNSVDHFETREYWTKEYPKNHGEAMTWAESSLNRLGPFVTDPRIAPMLEGPSTFSARGSMDEGAYVAINAPKGKLGEGKAYLFCAFYLAEFQNAAMSRIDLPQSAREPFTLLCDEYQNYTTDTLRQIITESRKVGLELMLATQEVVGSPRDEHLRRTVRKVAGNIFSFRLDREDAKVLVEDLFTPEIDQIKDFSGGKATYRSLGEVWEQEIRNLTGLPDRMLWWKRRGYLETHLINTLTVRDIEALPNYHLLLEARCRQDMAAFRLSGRPKKSPFLRLLPEPRLDIAVRRNGNENDFWTS